MRSVGWQDHSLEDEVDEGEEATPPPIETNTNPLTVSNLPSSGSSVAEVELAPTTTGARPTTEAGEVAGGGGGGGWRPHRRATELTTQERTRTQSSWGLEQVDDEQGGDGVAGGASESVEAADKNFDPMRRNSLQMSHRQYHSAGPRLSTGGAEDLGATHAHWGDEIFDTDMGGHGEHGAAPRSMKAPEQRTKRRASVLDFLRGRGSKPAAAKEESGISRSWDGERGNRSELAIRINAGGNAVL